MTRNKPNEVAIQLGRRAFVRNGVLVLSAAGVQSSLFAAAEQPALTVGMVTDLHFADKPAAGSRFYRESIDKLAAAAEEFGQTKLTFLVELGDFIDAADSVETELGYLKRIDRDFNSICASRHYVLGNHCVYTLKKQEFLETVGQQRSYYSFDSGDFHFVVLDACFRSDGQSYGRKNFAWTDSNIPAAEIDWLRDDLAASRKKTIVFAHQRLDVRNNYGVRNAAQMRGVLEESGSVLAVFQGHSHKNDYREIAGIHYCTLVAMVEGTGRENNGYSVMSIEKDGAISVAGYCKQVGYSWQA